MGDKSSKDNGYCDHCRPLVRREIKQVIDMCEANAQFRVHEAFANATKYAGRRSSMEVRDGKLYVSNEEQEMLIQTGFIRVRATSPVTGKRFFVGEIVRDTCVACKAENVLISMGWGQWVCSECSKPLLEASRKFDEKLKADELAERKAEQRFKNMFGIMTYGVFIGLMALAITLGKYCGE